VTEWITLGKLFTLMCSCHQAVVTGVMAVMLCVWEGNHGHDGKQ